MVTCQEVGHDFGLDHQDENFNNVNLGTCMDYTNNPSTNQHPNSHDYDELVIIYSHLDSTTTISAIDVVAKSLSRPQTMGEIMADAGQWGMPIRFDREGRPNVFMLPIGVDHEGNPEFELTHVFWAPVDPFEGRFDPREQEFSNPRSIFEGPCIAGAFCFGGVMKSRFVIALIPLLIAGCNTAGQPTEGSIVDALRAESIEVTDIDRIAETALGVAMVVYSVPGGELQLYTFASSADAERVASSISPDGMKIGTSAPLWIAPPHFFRRDEVIVNYLGTDARVLAALGKIVGSPIAGH
jgi:hypothetical protein